MSPTSVLRVIPVWVRLLAGVVAAAAVLAIVLLIRGVLGQVIDAVAFIRLAAQAILYLALIALFGYVAASGLPPTHWLRNAGHPLWQADTEPQLAPDLHRYLALLHARHPGIRECWLLDTPEPGEWRLLAIADASGLEAVRADWDIRRKTVRLYLLETHSPSVVLAWGRSSPVPFAAWDWEPQSELLAEFRCPATGEIRLARRLWG
ncbi:MAG: hypothetical protein EXR82_11565 [Gammaproteobacteria bacterium]|nr:hypothetical protein [Gammaproteobacteria bacterium]